MATTSTISPAGSASVTIPLRGSVADACLSCADRLVAALESVSGVTEVSLSSATATLRVVFDPTHVTADDVQRRADTEAHRLASEFGHQTYQIQGMDCANCALSVEKTVSSVPGVLRASVNFAASRMHVEHQRPSESDAAAVTALIEKRVRDLGFGVSRSEGDTEGHASHNSLDGHDHGATRKRDLIRVGFSGGLLALGLLLQHVPGIQGKVPSVITTTIYAVSLALGGWRFAVSGVRALRQKIVGTNLLMAVAAVGAACLGEWSEAAAVVFLYAVGEALEGVAMDRTRRSLAALVEAAPSEALVQHPTTLRQETIPVARLALGDVLVVKPGAKLAADGVIVSGESALTEAAITGESLPRDKKRGDTVFAGSVNGNGSLLVRVTALPKDSTLARILHLVEDAQSKKAPAQALVEKFGRVYTPIVMITALLLAVVGPLIVPGVNWLYRSLTLLVVACPCALIIATPVAYVSGIARAARNGVLVKGGAYLEALANCQRIALDKTGTLTTGEPKVSDLFPASGVTIDELLTVAAAAEAQSGHPIAATIVREAATRGLPQLATTSASAIPGRGVTAVLEDKEILVGTSHLLSLRNVIVPLDVQTEANRLSTLGGTTLLVAHGSRILGVIAVSDSLRPEAIAAVEELRRLGLTPTILTGDSEGAARRIAALVKIDDVRAALLPEDKLAAVRAMTENGDRPAFVGDGINDAPALAASSVGIAMGTGGTAAAIEAADIALMQSDLSRLPWAIRLARATRAVVLQNVILALGTVAVLLIATFTGWLKLPVGVVGHEASALIVIINGLRLLSPQVTRL
jgi:Cd2+/Zn2+-exporting ATPase